MEKRKYNIILLEIVLAIVLLFALFTSKILARYVLAIGLGLLVLILKRNYRIKSDDYIYGKQVSILMILFGVVYIFFKSFLRMVYPFIIYLILENTYAKSNLALSYKSRKNGTLVTSSVLVVLTLLVMLISCQFKYGIVVIGSSSMTGTINKGDAVIYKRYEGEKINTGQVIMFNSNGFRVIHRVIKISQIDGEMHYITKGGDANKDAADDYRTNDDIYNWNC